MVTIEELKAEKGDRVIYQKGAFHLMGVIREIVDDGTRIWVEKCNSASPIDELFPGRQEKMKQDDNGFGKLPREEYQRY